MPLENIKKVNNMDIQELIENFELFDDWEDKYRYLIDLGEHLPQLPPELHSEEWKVSGCQSQVWLVPAIVEENGQKLINFRGDSDAAIVKGIIAIVLSIFTHKTPQQIKEIEVENIFAKLGLSEHLSPSRRNGLGAMTEKIRYYASVL